MAINFDCIYESFYRDIVANSVTIVGETYVSSSENEGKFSFNIKQFTNSSYVEETGSDFGVELGSHVYFKLAMENPIQNLSYAIDG